MNVPKDHNQPRVVLELSPEEAAFLMANCNSNIRLGLVMLSGVIRSRPGMEKAVKMIEFFKTVREKMIKQGVDGTPDKEWP